MIWPIHKVHGAFVLVLCYNIIRGSVHDGEHWDEVPVCLQKDNIRSKDSATDHQIWQGVFYDASYVPIHFHHLRCPKCLVEGAWLKLLFCSRENHYPVRPKNTGIYCNCQLQRLECNFFIKHGIWIHCCPVFSGCFFCFVVTGFVLGDHSSPRQHNPPKTQIRRRFQQISWPDEDFFGDEKAEEKAENYSEALHNPNINNLKICILEVGSIIVEVGGCCDSRLLYHRLPILPLNNTFLKFI